MSWPARARGGTPRLGVGDGCFDGGGAAVFHDQPLGLAIRDDARVAALGLRIVQEGHQGALFAAVAAAQHTEAALVRIAIARVALN